MKLIDDWKAKVWKLWSVRLAAIASAMIAYVLAAPDVLLSVLNSMPTELRAAFPPFAGMGLFAFVTLVRLWKQSHHDDC